MYKSVHSISAQFYIEYRPNIILSISSYSSIYFITIFDTLTSNYDIHLCTKANSGQTTTYTIAANPDLSSSLIWNIGIGLSAMSSFSSTGDLGIAVTAGASPGIGLVQTTGSSVVSISLIINTSRIHPMNRISTPPVGLQSGYYVNGSNYINITDTTSRTFTSSIGGITTSGNYVIDNIGKIALLTTSAIYSFTYTSSSIDSYSFDSTGSGTPYIIKTWHEIIATQISQFSLSLLSDGTFIASDGSNTSNYTVDSSGNILTGSLGNLSDALSSYISNSYDGSGYATSIIDVSNSTKPNSTTTNVQVSDSYNSILNFT